MLIPIRYVCFFALLISCLSHDVAADDQSERGPGDHIEVDRTNGMPTTVTVRPLTESMRSELSAKIGDTESIQDYLAIYVAADPDARPIRKVPAVTGRYELRRDTLTFTPKYPFQPGVRYSVMWSKDGKRSTSLPQLTEFEVPRGTATQVPGIEAIYPSTAELPENHFRFYLVFKSPMPRGELYSRLKLIRDDGKVVPEPFLELGEELWDREGKRFTLYLEPGRIKHALVPREELGPILESGRSYTLVIEPGWRDAFGTVVEQATKHSFKVGSAQHDRIRPAEWQVTAPASGTRQPLTIRFPVAMDYALSMRAISVDQSNGSEVQGKVAVSEGEKLWTFIPQTNWERAEYRLQIDPVLEDTAGNNPAVALETQGTPSTTPNASRVIVTRTFQTR